MSSAPLTIDVPHRLGKQAAIERLKSRIGELDRHLPGGGKATSHWVSDNVMALEVIAMGQTVSARLEVEDALVRVQLVLPAMLGFFSGMISSAVREGGAKVLEDKSKN
ncbi:hypothetical protein FHS31_001804 [Sphingomonas vulcanisoli]|uniref:Polyhydroxyalkanoic acid system protein n=1 Tax=Sphingomonas vulcanisoli TaxID=1658060 RepID=A0ABX0TUX5_9SPHN|nr:polyhydroxyalkanoic acid system family protein [Sphingomonas vulcanisoli]NIJ08187.1 hypothetical protein [Sphingomonas vulcanisoli]